MKPLLCFIHIVKTGGMTLIDMLNRNFEKRQISRWSHWEPPFLDYMRGDESQFHNLECIHGHGSIKDFENLECFKDRQKIYITLLRDPVQRTLSYYYHSGRRKPEKHGTLRDKMQWLHDVKVDDYFRRRVNSATWALSGDEILNNESLEKAKLSLYQSYISNIYFGITELFDKSIRFFREILNLKTIQYENQNVNEFRPKKEEDYLIKTIKHLNKYDIKLYNYAKRLFLSIFKEN